MNSSNIDLAQVEVIEMAHHSPSIWSYAHRIARLSELFERVVIKLKHESCLTNIG